MREGIIPILLGTAVTTSGVVMRSMDMKRHGMSKHDTKVALGSGIVGLGVAHIILGAIDDIGDRK